jgi:hypothetical protein
MKRNEMIPIPPIKVEYLKALLDDWNSCNTGKDYSDRGQFQLATSIFDTTLAIILENQTHNSYRSVMNNGEPMKIPSVVIEALEKINGFIQEIIDSEKERLDQ